jgi:outer membrane lipoprotein carrier protein
MKLHVSVFAFVLLPLASSAQAQDLGADDVMSHLRQKFESAGMFSSHFRQTLDADFAESTSTVEGTIVASGYKYRIETEDQTIVTDGKTTWVYVIEDEQVIVNDFVDDDGSFTPGHFLDARADRYDASFAEEQSLGQYVVVLRAKSPDTYLESATLWINNSDFTVSRINVVDVNGAFIGFEMSEIEFQDDEDEATFTFAPADGVEVVDLR